MRPSWCLVLALWPAVAFAQTAAPAPTLPSPFQVVDLNVGEAAKVTLPGGKEVAVRLMNLDEQSDALCNAVRRAEVRVEVDGKSASLVSANYRLPTAVGDVLVDCPVTRGYVANSKVGVSGSSNPWGLDKDARVRVWPAGTPVIDPETFRYPAQQRWFASGTQMANEPTHVDGGENPLKKSTIYYHYGLDIGGAEGLVDVTAATDALVISAGTEFLPGYEDSPARPRYDVVYLLDGRGWYYRYSHLQKIAPEVKPGARVKLGQFVGVLGKEGTSGGWSHLHFDISSRQPSGKWGIIDGYAFLWDAYLREHKPALLAVARPHLVAAVNEPVLLDGSRSWSADSEIASYDWTFGDGTTASGATVERTYAKPGLYSEILKISDSRGRVDYDFAVVNVLNKSQPEPLPPTIHAAYAPTFGLKPGDEITFKTRSFRTTDGQETWDFGDGTPTVQVQSDGNVKPLNKEGYAVTKHRYAQQGRYLVKVQRQDRHGQTATARLLVRVGVE